MKIENLNIQINPESVPVGNIVLGAVLLIKFER
jgi:hypothetical protein